jgi:hypothetical protein
VISMRLAIAALLVALTAQPVFAQSDPPDDYFGSLAITLEQLSEDVVNYISQREGIAVFYVLPRGWEVAEQGVDPETGEINPDMPKYIVGSRSPVIDEEEAPDLVFELNIYRHGLLEEMPEGLGEDERRQYEQDEFFNFLDVQLATNIALGLSCANPNEIYPKPYGLGSREPTYFVPIYYETEGGSMVYTFTSVTAGKVWMLKFLVKESQIENYTPLVSLIVNNCFALTDADFAAWQEYMEELQEQQGDS